MNKCDSYRLQPEQHYFVDKYGAPILRKRSGKSGRREEFFNNKNVFEEIEGMIGEYWGQTQRIIPILKTRKKLVRRNCAVKFWDLLTRQENKSYFTLESS